MSGDTIKEKEISKVNKFENKNSRPKENNMFLETVGRIGKELNISNCWVCGDTGMSEAWPWEGMGLSVPETIRLMRNTPVLTARRSPEEAWSLKAAPIGGKCI